MKRVLQFSFAALLAGSLLLTGCGKKGDKKIEIRATGSDTMLQLIAAWRQAYIAAKPTVSVNAKGGGSGTGFTALKNNTTDICNASREIKKGEIADIQTATGKAPVEHTVAFDALALYVHPSNPIKEITIEQLREIWSEGGSITNWEQIDPAVKGKIVLIGRQSSSGTYDYFREHICGKTGDGKQREFRQGISELNGSNEIVETVSKTPLALGYSGMGYHIPGVNWLKVANQAGEPAVEPGVEAARTKAYPISRGLYLYTVGEPEGEIKGFVDWVKGPEGQKIVAQEGFVPVTPIDPK